MNLFLHNLFRSFFFGNYFYGICFLSLSIESVHQQKLLINDYSYYLILFCLTVIFYTKAYITDRSGYPSNERDEWYELYRTPVKWSQIILFIIAFIFATQMTYSYWEQIAELNILQLILLLFFPSLAFLYYGINSGINLRSIGWLKPFIIGFCWAGLVTIYPLIFNSIENKTEFALTPISIWLFLKNFLFISILCIMFDLKDESADSKNELKTFVVRKGVQFTVFYIILPLSLVGLSVFILFAYMHQFHIMQILINSLPFLLMIFLAFQIRKKRSLLYYLVFVDGLMLLKGICGIVAMRSF